MKYYLFLDESGDHGLANIDYNFPVFVLSGIILSEANYQIANNSIDAIKQKFWKNKTVIFHSRDIRKCEKEFKILFDLDLKKEFYRQIDRLVTQTDYNIIASAIHKEKYIKKYGRLNEDVYEIALSFILERAVFYLDGLRTQNNQLEIIIEKRGKKEDQKLERHFDQLRTRGTFYVDSKRIANYCLNILFRDKKENINGLQLADLVAYPIARYVIDATRANPAFDLLLTKFYKKGSKRYGLKIFP
jgi:hypothetical protein